MLEYVYRFSVRPGRMGEFLAFLDKHEPGFDEHGADDWHYQGSRFVVRGFGSYDCEMRWTIDDYSALGSGFGDEENVKMLAEFFGEFVDHTNRPEAVLMKTRDVLSIAEGT